MSYHLTWKGRGQGAVARFGSAGPCDRLLPVGVALHTAAVSCNNFPFMCFADGGAPHRGANPERQAKQPLRWRAGADHAGDLMLCRAVESVAWLSPDGRYIEHRTGQLPRKATAVELSPTQVHAYIGLENPCRPAKL